MLRVVDKVSVLRVMKDACSIWETEYCTDQTPEPYKLGRFLLVCFLGHNLKCFLFLLNFLPK